MRKKTVILFLLLLVQIIIHRDINLIIVQSLGPEHFVAICRDTGDFKSDSVVKHRDAALDTLSSNFSFPGYTVCKATRAGGNQAGDLVNTIVLCPPNIKPEACRECVKQSVPNSQFLKKNGKSYKLVMYSHFRALLDIYNSCMVRYADYRIEQRFDNWAITNFSSPRNNANKVPLSDALTNLVDKKLKEEAAGGGEARKFAAGKTTYGSGFTTVYAAVQCTPDISKDECLQCLKRTNYGIGILSVRGKMSGRHMAIHCYSRFAHEPFIPSFQPFS